MSGDLIRLRIELGSLNIVNQREAFTIGKDAEEGIMCRFQYTCIKYSFVSVGSSSLILYSNILDLVYNNCRIKLNL